MNNKSIEKGSIVKYTPEGESGEGHYRVSAKFKNTANLCSVFGSKIYHRGVKLTDLVEDYDGFMKSWQQSETYMSM